MCHIHASVFALHTNLVLVHIVKICVNLNRTKIIVKLQLIVVYKAVTAMFVIALVTYQ